MRCAIAALLARSGGGLLATPRGVARMAATAAAADDAAVEADDPLVQYLVLRRDLQETDAWPLGALIAQGAHAAVAAVARTWDTDETRAYVAPAALGSMTKAVLELKGEAQLRTLAAKLDAADVAHELWIEQPEDTPTCLATAPGRKSALAPHFKKCRLSTWHEPRSKG
mmetsp:Transcript_33698/g.103400  ORF Transcript_33698/g.103400 Transcript_33698/m.103400 type:complete len:169 (-) Transcript_33698:177-683(-)